MVTIDPYSPYTSNTIDYTDLFSKLLCNMDTSIITITYLKNTRTFYSST